MEGACAPTLDQTRFPSNPNRTTGTTGTGDVVPFCALTESGMVQFFAYAPKMGAGRGNRRSRPGQPPADGSFG